MVPARLKQNLHGLIAFEGKREAAILVPCLGNRGHARAEIDLFADAQPLGVADESLPAAKVDALVQRRADARVASDALRAAPG